MITDIKRDVTRALYAVLGAQNTNNKRERNRYLSQAAQILTDLDARTGRKDPSKRRRPAKRAKTAKRATKKASRSSRRR